MDLAHPTEELLTTASAALVATVVPDTVRLWRRLGKISPSFLTPTGIALYRRVDIDALVDQRTRRRVRPPQSVRTNSVPIRHPAHSLADMR
jgi:hypothetical protein